jgi:CheY-like chemotaxis protein
MRKPRRAEDDSPRTGLVEPATQAPRRRVVLLAEDDASMRELVASSLRKGGYAVVEATDGADLVEQLGSLWIEDRIPDAIVTDVRMPRLNGLDFLAGLRRPKWTIPVVVITAFGDRALHEEALRLGAAAVLDKPFRMAALRSTLESVLPKVQP